MSESQSVDRAQLSSQAEAMKPVLEKVYSQLRQFANDGDRDWYISLVYERRATASARANNKKTALDEDLNEGLVLRVYDGSTMYEEACDQMGESELLAKAERLAGRVMVNSVEGGDSLRPYSSPSWSDRLQAELDPEITSQIPQDVDSETWVNFGTRWGQGYWGSSAEILQHAQSVLSELSQRHDDLPDSSSAKGAQMLTSIVSSEVVEYLFVDESVKMAQTLTRDRVVAFALKDGQRGVVIKGGLGGLETTRLMESDYEEVFDNLQMVMDSEPLKPGRYKLLMHPAISGVFAHEAFGHTQEGDTWARGRSKAKMLFENKIKVGNEHSNILNNPAVFKNGNDDFAGWGSYYFDEEGWLAQSNYLVKDGVLQAPMTNLTSSLRLNVPRTANGKRESWTNAIYTRQTNTYFEEGDLTFDELLGKIDYGFLATVPYGGMEDPKGMGIQVGIQFLQEVQDGKLTGKVFKGPAGGSIQMTGYVPDYLNAIMGKTKIDAFENHQGEEEPTHPWNEAGGCGKYHKESVVAGCGGPYMLVDDVLLG
ncbi:MAG: TldD/PmbA family protein [Bdellovibrionales bacterium]|nr:TldD/PmbA family protein [Bdellovibrionales bacterium]